MRRLRQMMHAPHICGKEHEFWLNADTYCTPEQMFVPSKLKEEKGSGEFMDRNATRIAVLCPLMNNPIYLDFFVNVLNEIDFIAPHSSPIFSVIGPSTVITDGGPKIVRTSLVCTVQSICVVTTINDMTTYHGIVAKNKNDMTKLENLLAWYFFDFPKSIICVSSTEECRTIHTKAEAEYHARMYMGKNDFKVLSLVNLMALDHQKPIMHTLYSHESLYHLSTTIMKEKAAYYTPYFFSHMEMKLDPYPPIHPHDPINISPFDEDAFRWGHAAFYARQHDRFSILSAFHKLTKTNIPTLVRVANKINYHGRKHNLQKNYQAFWEQTQDMWLFGDEAPCEQCLINRIAVHYEPFTFGSKIDMIRRVVQEDVDIHDIVEAKYHRMTKKTSKQEVDEIMETFFKEEGSKKKKTCSPKKKVKKPIKVIIQEESDSEEVSPETPQKQAPQDGSVYIPPYRNYISPYGYVGQKK